MMEGTKSHAFAADMQNLRSSYQKKRNGTNLYPPFKRPIIDLDVETVIRYTYWYEDEELGTRCLRIYDVPGTLSGNLLRLDENLPTLPMGDYEFDGDVIRPLNPPPHLKGDLEDDSEDVSAVLHLLPTISPDMDRHFTKPPKYESEIRNLLKCQGGDCPGTPISPHVVQLLGKTSNGLLVFPRYLTRPYVVGPLHPILVYKSWFLQLVQGVRTLHSLGIVHRDLRLDNLLFSEDHADVIIGDLESRWGNRAAPEILPAGLEAGWTPQSDIWDLGECIRWILYGNAPVNNVLEWEFPPLFAEVVGACQRVVPAERASLDEITKMLETI